jgi:hypothetical protein
MPKMNIMRRRALPLGALLVAAVFCTISTVFAAEVSQGKCGNYDQEKKTISVEEYNTSFTDENPYGEPTGVMNQYDVRNALIGIQPEPGDVLRIAYEVNGTDRIAIRVMNVSKQDLRKK